jgi:Transposase DDE domain
MVPNMTTILQRLTGEWAALLQPEAILASCGEVGYTGWRDRVLTPVTTVHLFLLQILHGNTACSHLPHLSGLRFSAAAYCQARAKLPLRFFDHLLERFGRAVQHAALDDGRWQGHRTFLVDGSTCSMPDTPALQDGFGQPTEQRPVFVRPFGSPRPFVRPGVRRTPAVKGVPRSRWLKTLGVHDQLVTWLKPKTCPSWLTRETLVLREVRYGIDTPGFRTRQMTLVTTLLEAEVYRVADLADLYRQRWQVETSLAQLKTTMQMDVLHCKTVPGVLKELIVFAIVYNLVRMVMCQSALLQHMGIERISFLDALRWLGAPSTGILLGVLIVNPIRPHRVEPRVKKRRPKSFPLMIKPRQELRQQLVQQELKG